MAEKPAITLKSSGLRATIEPDPYQDGAFILEVDGTPQSHVFIDDPELFFRIHPPDELMCWTRLANLVSPSLPFIWRRALTLPAISRQPVQVPGNKS
jgi:hypothetical protein